MAHSPNQLSETVTGAVHAVTPLSYRLELSFSDVDDLTEQARDWSLDFRQLERGAFCGQILQFGSGRVHVAEAKFRRSLHQTGMPPAGLRTIAIPANPATQFVWRGQKVSGNSLMLFPLGGELDSVSTRDFHVYTCSFPDDLLEDSALELGLGPVAQLFAAVEVIHCNPMKMRRLRRCLQLICEQAKYESEGFTDTNLFTRLHCELPSTLLSTIDRGSERGPRVTTPKREIALGHSISLIESQVRSPISVAKMAQSAGVSKRTLEYAFGERFGVSPKDYIMMMRLRAVRAELRKAIPGTTTIARLAANWGFWHMGQFASDYKRQFNELPSQTLARHHLNR